MGHRANYVVIRDRSAEAFRSQWGAMDCLNDLSEGPQRAEAKAHDSEPVEQLLGSCWAEGGYLLDFDQRLCIAFGHPLEPTNVHDDWATRVRAFGPPYLARIASKWPGWRLVLDFRGVDTFVEHLGRRGITSVSAGERGGDEPSIVFEHQA
jgi:hypothetical protein